MSAIVTYVCCDWFSRSFVGCFVTVLLLLSFDFWSVKVRPLTWDTVAAFPDGDCPSACSRFGPTGTLVESANTYVRILSQSHLKFKGEKYIV